MSETKDKSVIEVLRRLKQDLGEDSFVVVDHWDSDPSAIGIAIPGDHSQLVYISVDQNSEERFDYELENEPKSSDVVYDVAGRGTGCTFEELKAIVVSHLQVRD